MCLRDFLIFQFGYLRHERKRLKHFKQKLRSERQKKKNNVKIERIVLFTDADKIPRTCFYGRLRWKWHCPTQMLSLEYSN